MKNIIIIDDKNHALTQIKASIPEKISADFNIIHFENFESYQSFSEESFVVFLDFFLNKDKKPGIEFLKNINSEYLVGFSSKKIGSDIISKNAFKSKHWKPEKIYSI